MIDQSILLAEDAFSEGTYTSLLVAAHYETDQVILLSEDAFAEGTIEQVELFQVLLTLKLPGVRSMLKTKFYLIFLSKL